MKLDGRIAIVTGGASGIGAATATLLAESGARVVTWDLNAGADILCDVASLEQVTAALAETVERFGHPTVLAHCAGITARSSIIDLDVDSWDRVMAVNARGSFLCLGAVAKDMVENRPDEGSIVLVSSTASTLAEPGLAAYSTSKAGVNHLARVAAIELGPYNIRVNSVSPGSTETPLVRRILSDDDYRKTVIATTPLGQVGTPEQLAGAIVGTLQMDWITGQAIIADGGSFLVTPRGQQKADVAGTFRAGDA